MENLFETKGELIKQIKEKEDELSEKKHELKEKENGIWINTNFKELGLTNEDTRKAFVDNNINNLRKEKELISHEVTCLKRELSLCEDKIKLFTG